MCVCALVCVCVYVCMHMYVCKCVCVCVCVYVYVSNLLHLSVFRCVCVPVCPMCACCGCVFAHQHACTPAIKCMACTTYRIDRAVALPLTPTPHASPPSPLRPRVIGALWGRWVAIKHRRRKNREKRRKLIQRNKA